MTKETGIRAVARAAGVSISTVSHALNGTGRVGEQTRERVHQAARELGYRPSSLGRGLRLGRSGFVGVVVTKYGQAAWTFTAWPYFAAVIDAAMSAALDRGYALTVLPSDRAADAVGVLPLDGLFVLDPLADDPVVTTARRSGIPTVADRANSPADGLWVDIDHGAAVGDMCARLQADSAAADLAPVLLTSDGSDSYTAGCVAGYRAWCDANGLAAEVLRCPRDPERAATTVTDRMLQDPPRAAFGLEDHHAPLLADAAVRAGLTPATIALGCFTEFPEPPAAWPSMARLSVHPEATGSHGMTLLIDAIEGLPLRPDLREIETSLT